MLRLVAVVGVTPTVYVDSGEYRGVALLGGNRRPWTVPLLHALVGDGAARVVAHAVLGAGGVGGPGARARRRRAAPGGLQVAAAARAWPWASSPPIVNYDTTITSESVAISLAVLLVRGVAPPRASRRRWAGRRRSLAGGRVLFAFTRNDHPIAARCPRRWSPSSSPSGCPERAWAVLAVGLVVVVRVELVRRRAATTRSPASTSPSSSPTGSCPTPSTTEWFTDRGMPLPRGVEPGVGLVGGDTVLAFAGDRRVERVGRATTGARPTASWLLTHPHQLLLEPWPDLFGLRGDDPRGSRRRRRCCSRPATATAASARSLPDAGRVGACGAAATAAPVVLAGCRSRPPSPSSAGAGLLAPRWAPVRGAWRPWRLVLAAGHLLLVWHASPIELGRLAMVAATTIHVSLLVLLAITLDRLSVDLHPRSTTRDAA